MFLSKASLPRLPGRRGTGWRHLAAALAVVAMASGTASASISLSFTGGNITGNTNATGADYSVMIYGTGETTTIGNFTLTVGASEALFVFKVASGSPGQIHEVYFDDGTLLGIAGLIDADENAGAGLSAGLGDPGVNFVSGSASPPELPGHNEIDPPFVTTQGFLADSVNGQNSVGQGESLGILFSLVAGTTFSDLYDALVQGGGEGGLRIGIHVGDAGAKNAGKTLDSDAFVNGPPTVNPAEVPEPASFATVGIGTLLGLGYAWRKRKRAVV